MCFVFRFGHILFKAFFPLPLILWLRHVLFCLGSVSGPAAKTVVANTVYVGGWGVGTEVIPTGKSVSVSVRVVRAGEAELREFHP